MTVLTPPKDEQWIRLLSGGRFNYNDPASSDVTLDDLATALSNICRFSGHLPQFYSVAQHLVNTSYIVDEQFAFDALMHDTSEAFTNDLPTPLKWALPVFKELEEKIEAAMAEKFGFNFPYPPEIKVADKQMLILEKLHIKKDTSVWPNYKGIRTKHLLDRVDLSSWKPAKARTKFLRRYGELVAKQEQQKENT